MAGVTLTGNWKFIEAGGLFAIKNIDDESKFLIPSATFGGSVVDMKPKESSAEMEFKTIEVWKKSCHDNFGYFTLKTESGTFLSATSERNPPNTLTNTLTVEGLLLN